MAALKRLLVSVSITTMLTACGPGLVSAEAQPTAGKEPTRSPSFYAIAPQINASIEQRYKDRTASFLYPSGLLRTQLLEALAAPDGIRPRVLALPQNLVLVSGCRPRSCMEKAAVVAGEDGSFRSAALINYGCHSRDSETPRVKCSSKPSMTIFGPASEKRRYKQVFVKWAKQVNVEVEVVDMYRD